MLNEAYLKTRVISRAQYKGILRLLASFAEHLSSLVNQIMVTQAAAEAPNMTIARGFIFNHQREKIGHLQVARAVNMSTYYFCKVFKRSTGFTFTDYLARVRVESAKQMLRNPHMRVSEAAYEAGFQSLSQFNRVFRRVAGEAPSDYRSPYVVGAARFP
jgi:AraC-like DNA-binding protein